MSPVEICERYTVGILGATGTVGQRFIALLENHKWFVLTGVGASDRSAAKPYAEAVNWKISSALPKQAAQLVVRPCKPESFTDCDIIFSGLDASVAGDIEAQFAERGFPVFSNARNHRYDADVPILIPLINSSHLGVVRQKFAAKKGAGYPGIASLDMLDNIVPYISGEEEKLEYEPNKILGTFEDGAFQPASMKISAMSHRVSVTDGHTLSVSVKLGSSTAHDAVAAALAAWTSWKVPESVAGLPSCPEKTILVRFEVDRPQPRLDRDTGLGMTTVVGRVRQCPLLDIKFTITSHNTIIGAAGGSILNAELAVAEGLVTRISRMEKQYPSSVSSK